MLTPPLLLLSGWGMTPAALSPLLTALAQLPQPVAARVITPPVPQPPGPVDDGLEAYLDGWIEQLASVTPAQEDQPRPWLGGWSLGGMLATRLVAKAPQHFSGVISLAANACFVASPGWPRAMPRASFEDFMARYQQSPAITLKRFCQLCSQGETSKTLLKALRNVVESPQAPRQLERLELLARLDNRNAIKGLQRPQLHLFASADAMVPPSAADAVEKLAPTHMATATLPGGHAFPLSQPAPTARLMAEFIQQQAQAPARIRIARGAHEDDSSKGNRK